MVTYEYYEMVKMYSINAFCYINVAGPYADFRKRVCGDKGHQLSNVVVHPSRCCRDFPAYLSGFHKRICAQCKKDIFFPILMIKITI